MKILRKINSTSILPPRFGRKGYPYRTPYARSRGLFSGPYSVSPSTSSVCSCRLRPRFGSLPTPTLVSSLRRHVPRSLLLPNSQRSGVGLHATRDTHMTLDLGGLCPKMAVINYTEQPVSSF